MGAIITNRNIDSEAHEKLHDFERKGIQCFAFTPQGGWVIVTLDNQCFSRNIPDECFENLKALKQDGHRILWVAFSPQSKNSWSIITDRTFFNRNIPDDCHEKMVQIGKGKIKKLVFHPTNQKSWVIFHEDDFYARNIPDEAFEKMRDFNGSPRQVHHVAFDPDGRGWIVLADDTFFARDIDNEILEKLNPLQAINRRIDMVVFDPDKRGWSCIANDPDKIQQIEADLGNGKSVWDEMIARKVPGMSIAVVEGNALSWTRSYGHIQQGNPGRIKPSTIFQAASISKPITALGALRLVQAGVIGLDDNIANHLNNWNLPVQTGLVTRGTTTIRGLLSHSGGTNVSGFNGYASGIIQLPTTLQILNGAAPANNAAIQVVYDPGTNANYSGGGFTVLEKAMSDADSRPFANLMLDRVLHSLEMNDSFFGPNVPAQTENRVASAHDVNGNPVSGKRNRYPELAAAGLYTSAPELSKVIMMVNQGGRFGGAVFLGNDGAGNSLVQRELLRRQHNTLVKNDAMGLGFRLGNIGRNTPETWPDNFNYRHGGSNFGFKSYMRGYPKRNGGVVVMTNGNDSSFPSKVAIAIAQALGWE